MPIISEGTISYGPLINAQTKESWLTWTYMDLHQVTSSYIDLHRNCENVQNSRIFACGGRIWVIRGVMSSPLHAGSNENNSNAYDLNARDCGEENPFAQFAVCAIGLQIAIAQIAQTAVSFLLLGRLGPPRVF